MVSQRLCEMETWPAKEFSSNWTQILLEWNKVFPSFYPKIEGEKTRVQTFAKMVREMNKTSSKALL